MESERTKSGMVDLLRLSRASGTKSTELITPCSRSRCYCTRVFLTRPWLSQFRRSLRPTQSAASSRKIPGDPVPQQLQRCHDQQSVAGSIELALVQPSVK